MIRASVGACARLISAMLAFGMLASCGQQPLPSNKLPSDIDEMRADVAAVKKNPGFVDASKAGPPLHFDPYPKSNGMHGARARALAGLKMK